LKRLKTQGEVFDPRFHEPVQQIETTEQADGTIIHELRGGYILGDKVIRPALVNVVSNPSGPLPPVSVGASNAPEKAVERETKSASVATATEEAGQSSPAAKPDDSGVYDLGNLDDMV
jgi:molecular chaperone GrpE